MSTGSHPHPQQQLMFRPVGAEQPRSSNMPTHFQKVSVVTYPLSYSNSPIEMVYQGEMKRSVLFHSHNSNPEYSSNLSKSGDSGGHQDLRHIPVQPNVAVQMQYDKNKFSTPTHSTNYNDKVKTQQTQPNIDQRPRKGSDNIVMNKNESPVVAQVERRISMQYPSTVYVTKTVNISGSPFNGRPEQNNFRASCAFTRLPTTNTLTPPTADDSSQRGSAMGPVRIEKHPSPTVGAFSRGSPSTGQDPHIQVTFEYQQPQSTTPTSQSSSEKGRLDHFKTKTYADLVSRQSLPTQPSTERAATSRLSEGPSFTSSTGSVNPAATQSMHVRNERRDEPLQFKVKPRDKETPKNEDKKEQKSDDGNTEHEPGDAFKKDKGLMHQPFHPKEVAKFSPQNATNLNKQCDLKKSVRFAEYMNPTQNIPSNKMFVPEIQNKVSPMSFTKQKPLEAQAKIIGDSPEGSPPRLSESPKKNVRRQPKREDFRLGQKLGSGRYGDVYMVEHRITGMLFALKTFSKKLIKEQKLQDQFCHEIKLQSYMKHQNLVQLYGYFDDAENVYLILELCCDGQLATLLKRHKKMSEMEASQIVDQICNGMDFMHRHKIIHRDLKPENIILHSGVVKICDFGWAAHLGDGLRDTFCGTPLYISPEVLGGDKYGEKIDLWGIGVLTYQLLVGSVPFKINCQNDLHKIINDEIKFPESAHLSDRAKDFINQLMDKDPNNRLDMDEIRMHPFLAEYRSEYMKQL